MPGLEHGSSSGFQAGQRSAVPRGGRAADSQFDPRGVLELARSTAEQRVQFCPRLYGYGRLSAMNYLPGLLQCPDSATAPFEGGVTLNDQEDER